MAGAEPTAKRRRASALVEPPAGPFVREAAALQSEDAAREEWLLTIGNGGFAMGTVCGTPMRQYHTLLNAASAPPVGRVATVSDVEETIEVVAGGKCELRRYSLAPTDALPASHLKRFEKRTSSVSWTFEAAGVELRKTLHVGWQRNAAALTYSVLTPGPATLKLRPRVLLRDFHHRVQGDDLGRFRSEASGSGVRVEAGGYRIEMTSDKARYVPSPDSIEMVDYGLSRLREDLPIFGEPLYSPGFFEVGVGAGSTVVTLAWALAPEEPDLGLAASRGRELHLEGIGEAAAAALGAELAAILRPLTLAADDFLVTRCAGGAQLKSVIAGYPWFADWGRDTMISLPGLMLATGRFADARSCLDAFAQHVSEGMVPNCFDDDGVTVHYNTVDASLWFIEAVRAYAEASGERLAADGALVQAAVAVLRGYERGTRFGIRVDPADGLVAAGDANTQLTWMDALRDGVAFTPRHGKCVEINALWCNGLQAVAELVAESEPVLAEEFRGKGSRAAAAFNDSFVRADGLGLYDHLQPGDEGRWVPIAEVRPNQLFAVSLRHAPLVEKHRKAVLDVCREQLLTPVGLRTLSPRDPSYKGRFKGDMTCRDSAYHNGTVWPWLIGPYCESVLRVGAFSQEARDEVAGVLGTLLKHMGRGGCLGQIAEVYDGDEPRDQEGCTAQAWSVAEALRIAALLARAA